jgi:hypothetical protein
MSHRTQKKEKKERKENKNNQKLSSEKQHGGDIYQKTKKNKELFDFTDFLCTQHFPSFRRKRIGQLWR